MPNLTFLLSLMQLAGMLAGVMIGVFSDGLGLRRSIVGGQMIPCLAGVIGVGDGSLMVSE